MPGSQHINAVFTDADMGWYSHNPTSLTVKWNPDLLSNMSNSSVSLQLIGYNEANGVVSSFIDHQTITESCLP